MKINIIRGEMMPYEENIFRKVISLWIVYFIILITMGSFDVYQYFAKKSEDQIVDNHIELIMPHDQT